MSNQSYEDDKKSIEEYLPLDVEVGIDMRHSSKL